MKNPLMVSILAAVLSAICLGIVLVNTSATEAHGGDPLLPIAAPDVDLLARVEALAEENRELRDRLVMLELRPAPAQRTPAVNVFASKEEFDAFRDEVSDEFASLTGNIPGKPDAFRERVAASLSEIRKGEAVQSARARLEKRTATIERNAPKIAEWLGLTPDQSNFMSAAFLARYEREAEYIRQWEAGASEEIIGELKAIDRETHVAELAVFLTPEQLERFLSRGGGK